ncbi:hypothetical protein [Hyphomicrobium sp. MC1]|uniref:hypothetical protein n=1 Tax=Hyphomicrobium sp. (strain MC1) TaxID=717785 RepID=UPI000213ED90|nr:hypothetical protein [Hyphomicrobium sp. MC1]CCB66640.1 protein of unknown function [Hyphomicrobium sp. MC1]
MPVAKTFEKVRHHWWPAALSCFWADRNGEVSQLTPDGSKHSSLPKGFGFDKHSHNLRFGGAWNSSFEDDFSGADEAMGGIVDWLNTLEGKREKRPLPLSERLFGQPMTADQRATLSECVASLVVRSPLMRHRLDCKLKGDRERLPNPFPDKKETASDYQTTLAYNLRPLLRDFGHRMRVTGKFCLLMSEDRELIFGDGFYNNFPTSAYLAVSLKCIVPLTPTLAMLYTNPREYVSVPDLMTMVLRRDEVDFLNLLVQVYSCERLFYRCDRPEIDREYSARHHMQLNDHQHPWLEGLFEAVAENAG